MAEQNPLKKVYSLADGNDVNEVGWFDGNSGERCWDCGFSGLQMSRAERQNVLPK